MPRAIQLSLPLPPEEARPNLPQEVIDELRDLIVAQLLVAVVAEIEEHDNE